MSNVHVHHFSLLVWWTWGHCLRICILGGIMLLCFILFQVLGFPSSSPLPWMAGFRSSATGLCWSNTWWKKTAATTSARSATTWAPTSASPCTSRSKVRKKHALFHLLGGGLKSSIVSMHICLTTKWRHERWLDTAGLMCCSARSTVGVDSKIQPIFPLSLGVEPHVCLALSPVATGTGSGQPSRGAHLCREHPHVCPGGFVGEKPNMWSQMCSFQSFVFIHFITCELVCS